MLELTVDNSQKTVFEQFQRQLAVVAATPFLLNLLGSTFL